MTRAVGFVLVGTATLAGIWLLFLSPQSVADSGFAAPAQNRLAAGQSTSAASPTARTAPAVDELPAHNAATTEGDAVLKAFQERYAHHAPGEIILHQQHPLADVFLVRSQDDRFPVTKTVITYTKDIDTGERVETAKISEIANLLRVRLKPGENASAIEELAAKTGGAVLRRAKGPYDDTLLIYADPAPEKLGRNLVWLRAQDSVLQALPAIESDATAEQVPSSGH